MAQMIPSNRFSTGVGTAGAEGRGGFERRDMGRILKIRAGRQPVMQAEKPADHSCKTKRGRKWFCPV